MIRYALACSADHAFEAWFRNGPAFDSQAESGTLTCPVCGDGAIRKAPMAPGLVKRDHGPPPSLAELRRRIEHDFEDVGQAFAEEARQMHYGEADPRPIRGRSAARPAWMKPGLCWRRALPSCHCRGFPTSTPEPRAAPLFAE